MSLRSSFVVSPLAAASSACQLPSSKPAASRSRRLSCKATTGDDDAAVVDRRDVLLGLTGLAACSNLGLALAADVVPGCTTVPITDKVLECTPLANDRFYCPAQYNAKEVKDFSELPKSTGRPRVRRAVHLLEPKEVKRFEDAIKKMKELPDSDPRSFRNQRSIHEAYCDKHYNVVTVAADGSKTKVEPFDVHYSSVFAPWHRMYIYFFERILGDLVGDDTFALPYWNWDASDGMIIPSIFMDECSPLYHFDRNPDNVRAFMDLNLGLGKQPKCTTNTLCRQLKDNNLYSMYRQMTVDSPTCFHGASFCAAAADKRAKGSLENGGHTAAHIWVGGDMGNLKTAARDPIFYTNHANVDRLWHLWSTKLGGADPMNNKEWLATSFVFYDEQKRPVRITVNDVVDVKNLGYTYEKRDRVEWLDKRPKPAKGVVRTGSASVPFPLVPRIPASPTSFSNPITLKKGKNEYVKVERPEKARAGGLKPLEVLVVDMVVDPCDASNFKVLVNVPEGQEDKVGPNNSEYVGSFTQVPHGSGAGGMMDPVKVSHRFRLGELMEDLKSSGDDRYLNVTLVPVDGMNTVIKGMHVETLC